MDAVSEVIAARALKDDGLTSMLGASAMAHLVLLLAFVLLPAWWFGADQKPPETIMQISLGGPVGPNDGGMETLGGRTIQQAVPIEPKKPIEPVRPPSAKTPEMVEPTKAPPKKATPNKVEAKDPRSNRPAKGAEVQQGSSIAETKAKGMGFGLSSGGGGTGGHLTPALAIAAALETHGQGLEPVLVGAVRGVEARILPTRDYRYHLLPSEPIYRRQWWKNIRWPLLAGSLLRGVDELLRAERPAAVLGTGTAQAVNIANQGTAIIGTHTGIDSAAGVLYGQAGVATNINDGNLATRIDTWNGNQAHAANPVSFVGVIFGAWPTIVRRMKKR